MQPNKAQAAAELAKQGRIPKQSPLPDAHKPVMPDQPGKATTPPEPKLVQQGGGEMSRTITLDFPVTFAGEYYGQLTVRRLKAKDFRKLDTISVGGNAAAIAMSALICNVDEAIIDELDATDYLKVQEVIADFFPSALVGKLQPKGSA
jgi:hypothetical protein